MKCSKITEKLYRYVDKEISGEELQIVEEHIKECIYCKERIDHYRKVNDIIKGMEQIKESKSFEDRFKERLSQVIEEKEAREQRKINLLEKIKDFFAFKYIPRIAVGLVSLFFVINVIGNYMEKDVPVVSNVKGEAYVYNTEKAIWNKIKKNMKIKETNILKTNKGAQLDIEVKNKYYVRLKEKTQIKVSKIGKKNLNSNTKLTVENGNLLVDIAEGFKGSKFKVQGTKGEVQALGTKFLVSVVENKDNMAVMVAEGKVKFREIGNEMKFGEEHIVETGMRYEIGQQVTNKDVMPLIDEQWEQIAEIYMLGEKTKIALLISMTEDRVRQLLMPCPIFISDEEPRTIPIQIEEVAKNIKKAIEKGENTLHEQAIIGLIDVINQMSETKYNVQILLFVGAYYRYISKYEKAIEIFDLIEKQYSTDNLVSLAVCAKALIYEEDLVQIEKAKEEYRKIRMQYSGSLERLFAEKKLNELI